MKSGGWGMQTTDGSRILLTKCGIASRRLAARSSVIHPSTAARLRHPDRTSGAASWVETKG